MHHGLGSLPRREGQIVTAIRNRPRELPLLAGPTCCPSGLTEPMDRQSAEALAALLKAVADPARLQLLALIRAADAGEACVCDLVEPLGLSQPTVSHHLKVLAEAGLISRQKRGTWAWYSVMPERLEEIAAIFRSEP
jgi:ArsR family transcriptional regulator, arsenate/arsenite/antimonite-responsive transcriptional repressor